MNCCCQIIALTDIIGLFGIKNPLLKTTVCLPLVCCFSIFTSGFLKYTYTHAHLGFVSSIRHDNVHQ